MRRGDIRIGIGRCRGIGDRVRTLPRRGDDGSVAVVSDPSGSVRLLLPVGDVQDVN
jgi:hypothetical protein